MTLIVEKTLKVGWKITHVIPTPATNHILSIGTQVTPSKGRSPSTTRIGKISLEFYTQP